jgi:predicted RNA-binding Zn ribbon-like protein
VTLVHVRADSLEDEVRITVDAAVEISNELITDDTESSDEQFERLRAVLVAHDFLRARRASADELAELADRCQPLARLVRSFPDAELAAAVAAVNHQLQGCAIAPTLSAHDGFALHIHWTAADSPFAHQVTVDLLMALAQTLCDHGTARFGRCAADDCVRTFYDTTKNRSRRFCADPRCASRTHTAAHRARRH